MTAIQNNNRMAFEIVRSLSAPFITLLVIFIISADITSKTHSPLITETFIVIDILAIVCYFAHTIYTIAYIDKYHRKYDVQAPEWFISLVKGVTPIHRFIYYISILIARRLKIIEKYVQIIKLLVNYNEVACKIKNWFRDFITYNTETLNVSKRSNKECHTSRFQEEFESLDSKLIYAIIEYLRPIKENRRMHYGCVIILLYTKQLLSYNALVPTHIEKYFKNYHNLDCPHRTNIQDGINTITAALDSRGYKSAEDKTYNKYLECYEVLETIFHNLLQK